MTVMEWLENVKKLDIAVENLINRRDELRCLATKITVGEQDDMPHASGTSDKVGNLVAKFVDMEADINRAIDKYVDYKTTVCMELIKLPTNSYQALYLHYVEYKPWTVVADEMGYSTKQIHRFKNAGIEILEKSSSDVLECYTIPMV